MLQVIDLFKQMDVDRSCSLTREELFAGLTRMGCPLDNKQLEILVKTLDVDHNNEIDVE